MLVSATVALILAAPSQFHPDADAIEARAPHRGAARAAKAENCSDLSSEPVRFNITYDEVQAAWGRGGCTGCHNQAALGELRLDTAFFALANIYLPSYKTIDGVERIRTVPGDPNSSLLYTLMNCQPPPQYLAMPISGQTFADVRALIYDWIAAGAIAFDENGQPTSDILFRSGLESERF